jgi:hypothetical protein
MDLGSCGLNGDDCVVVIAGWRRASKAVVVSVSKAGSKEAAGRVFWNPRKDPVVNVGEVERESKNGCKTKQNKNKS